MWTIPERPDVALEVDPFRRDDLDAGARLYRAAFNGPPWNDDWTVETARTRLAEIVDTPGYRGFAASTDGELVGLAVGNAERWHTGEHFHLKEMCVRPEEQGSGIGTRLVAHLVEDLRDAGVERVYLLTARDGPASAFYRSRGFRREDGMRMHSRRLEP